MLVQVVYTLLVSQSQIAHWLVYINPLFRVLDFMIGMFLAAECTKIKEKSKWSGLLLFLPVVIMVLSCFVGESIPYIKNMFLNVIWIPASIIIIKMLYEVNAQNTVPQGIIYGLGGIGLELFLIHQLVIRYANHIITSDAVIVCLIKVVLCLFITIILAIVFHKTTEKVHKKFC